MCKFGWASNKILHAPWLFFALCVLGRPIVLGQCLALAPRRALRPGPACFPICWSGETLEFGFFEEQGQGLRCTGLDPYWSGDAQTVLFVGQCRFVFPRFWGIEVGWDAECGGLWPYCAPLGNNTSVVVALKCIFGKLYQCRVQARSLPIVGNVMSFLCCLRAIVLQYHCTLQDKPG